MKIGAVSLPASTSPARNRFGTLLSSVDGSWTGTPVRGIDGHPARLEQVEIGVIAGHQEDVAGGQSLALTV
jgi:hypothetical protein